MPANQPIVTNIPQPLPNWVIALFNTAFMPSANCYTSLDISVLDPCNCSNPNNISTVSDVKYIADTLVVRANACSLGNGLPNSISGLSINLSANDGHMLDTTGNPIPIATPIPEEGTSGMYKLPFYTAPGKPSIISVTDVIFTSNFTTDSCLDCPSVPTIGEWGLIILSLLLVIVGVAFILEKNNNRSIVN